MAEKTKKAFVIRAFNDAGTERSYSISTPGKPDTMPEIAEGAFANFEHAGLVRVPTDDEIKAPAENKGGKPA